MPRVLSVTALRSLPIPGQTIFVGGGIAEPAAILEAWREAGSLAGVTMIGLQLPGLNRVIPEAFGPGCRYRTAFLTAALRPSFAGGRVELLAMHYSDFHRHLRERAAIDLAVFQVSPPDAEGMCSLGPCADHVPALLARDDVRLVAQVNPSLPVAVDGVSLRIDRLWGIHHADRPLPEPPPDDDSAAARAIAERVATLVADGDCVQVGIGRLPDALLRQLRQHRGLTLHTGLLTAAGLALRECGAARRIVTGAAVGSAAHYGRAAASDVQFRPVSVTHSAEVLERYERMIAVNSALEIDLFGQVNCESAGARLVSAFGGINDFVRAAHRVAGGRAVIALPARFGRGDASRIVARLSGPGLVAVQRGDVDVVVSEFGAADLRGLDLDARAGALIAIAAPEFRDGLAAAWAGIRSTL